MTASRGYVSGRTGRWVCALHCLILSITLFSASAQEPSPFAQRLTTFLSPAQKEDEQKLESMQERLEELPPLSPGHRGENAGFHSRFQSDREAPLELVVDLGQPYPVDRIAVFPARGMFRGATIEGYGFPERFVMELSTDATFTEPVISYDSREISLPPRPDYPVQFKLEEPVDARFVRLRVLEHRTRKDGRFLSAFGELMVLAEGRNVARYAPVEARSLTVLPDWNRDHLVDGLTDLGLPVDPEPSPTNGFLSKPQDEPVAEKWVQIELPRSVAVEEVALIPAQPVDAPDQFGHGFPRRFRLLTSDDPDFTAAQVLADYREMAFPNPGDNPVVFTARGASARFVRLEVTELGHISGGKYSITLAEMQVFENGNNVAIGAKVTYSDVFSRPGFEDVWRPEYLVDGFSSQNRLIGLEDWLDGLDERREVETRIADLEGRIETRIHHTLGWVLGGAVLVVLTSVGVIGMLLLRRKRALAQQQEALRARIARDLHDDLGSRLGGMRLLSESLLGAKELPTELRGDLDLLHRSSGEATDAMRDIVWLLDTRERSLEKLRQQMKRLVPSIVGSTSWEFHIDEAPDAEVNFEFRRQVVLAFRESLNNAARHSKSDRIECRVGGDSEQFSFEVRDWGQGFDEASVKRGLGINNLRKRAEALGGKIEIASTPGEGTVVTFSAPHRNSKKDRLRATNGSR